MRQLARLVAFVPGITKTDLCRDVKSLQRQRKYLREFLKKAKVKVFNGWINNSGADDGVFGGSKKTIPEHGEMNVSDNMVPDNRSDHSNTAAGVPKIAHYRMIHPDQSNPNSNPNNHR